MLFISFFSNLFEKFIGFDKGKSKQEEIFIINEKQIFTKINSLDSYSGAYFPIFYIENNLIYLNGFINYQDKKHFFDESDKNSILKAINYGNLLINEKYNDFSNLNLKNVNCGSLGIEILIKMNFHNLKVLKLSGSKMTSNSILLFKDSIFSNLTELDLSNNGIGNLIIENLDKSNLINLTKLNLSSNMISNEGLKLFSSKNFEKLIELNLSYNGKIDDIGIKYLKNSKLSNLKALYLECIDLVCDGLNFIVELPFANSIENLALYLSNKIKYEDIQKIYHNYKSNLINLKNLTFTREDLGNLNLRFLLIGDYSSNREVYYYIDESKGYRNHLSTIGIDFTTKIVLSELKIKVKAQFWVSTLFERSNRLPKTNFKGAKGCILSFYMGNKSSFDVVKIHGQTISQLNIPFAILAKKNGDEINETNIQSFIDKFGGKVFYYDDNNKKGIDEAIGYLAEKYIK